MVADEAMVWLMRECWDSGMVLIFIGVSSLYFSLFDGGVNGGFMVSRK